MKRIVLVASLLMITFASQWSFAEETSAAPQGEPKFLDKYPHLRDNLYQEPDSGFQLGLSLGVLGVVSSRMFFSFNFFQVNYITPRWDNELFSVAYGVTSTSAAYLQSDHFLLRSIPKYRWSDTLSVGVLLVYEFVSFPNIPSKIYKNGQTTQLEPFSSSGPIYGLGASQNIKLEGGTKFKITEVVYEETYSTSSSGQGWQYIYFIPALAASTSTIQAGLVIAVEVGFYY